MNLNLTPEVNEVYLPRISQRLRSQGMLNNACNCNTCGTCSTSTSRWLRGISRSARPSGYYQQQTYGNRYPIYSRPYGNRFVHLLADAQNADGAQAPAIVDVNVDVQTADHADTRVDPMPMPSNDDAGAQGADGDELFEFETKGAKKSSRPQDLSVVASAVLTNNVKDRIAQADSKLFGEKPRAYVFRPQWVSIGSLNIVTPQKAIASETAILDGTGLYMLSWRGKNNKRMNYLGLAESQMLRTRILQHKLNPNTLASPKHGLGSTDWAQVSVYCWKMHDQPFSPVRFAENAYLSMIVSEPNGKIPKSFEQRGFANSQQESEFIFSS